jgi:hypothetical protein
MQLDFELVDDAIAGAPQPGVLRVAQQPDRHANTPEAVAALAMKYPATLFVADERTSPTAGARSRAWPSCPA